MVNSKLNLPAILICIPYTRGDSRYPLAEPKKPGDFNPLPTTRYLKLFQFLPPGIEFLHKVVGLLKVGTHPCEFIRI